ncbi:MAG: hypothetical protein KatS3mg044_1196 [Rhodothermaceae bacterium]|nr:MAG: hypothetical protein KatS3mg044_1196 [Rhodothermaceae bacterium]
MGWSCPIVPPPYVVSSRTASTCTFPRGFVRKLYHSSVRTQRAGSIAVEGCTRSTTFTVAVWISGWLAK